MIEQVASELWDMGEECRWRIQKLVTNMTAFLVFIPKCQEHVKVLINNLGRIIADREVEKLQWNYHSNNFSKWSETMSKIVENQKVWKKPESNAVEAPAIPADAKTLHNIVESPAHDSFR